MTEQREEQAAEVRLVVELDRRIHFALQENDVPVVQSLTIENGLERDLVGLRVRILGEPDFALPWEKRVDLVQAGTSYRLGATDLALSPSFLSALTERTRGQLVFELESHDGVSVRQVESIELFARDEWPGLASLPEILAAFVLPNHPTIEEVLGRAAGILGRWTEDSALSGYQAGDPKRVFTTAAAVYHAIQNLDLSYINPPASFEVEGQRVRLPDRILDAGLGTCLDLALLTAACLEQTGLNPLLVLVEGHAFVGVWLRDECFGEAANLEPLRFRKRVDLNEILVFDPTAVTLRPGVGFERARTEARHRLEDVGTFQCALDIQRARRGQIRPLPQHIESPSGASGTSGAASESAEVAPVEELTAPDLSEFVIATDPELGALETEEAQLDSPATRLDRWQRRLLDLTLRNRLINFRPTKKTIPLLCPDLGGLEDAIAEGAEFKLLPRLQDQGAGDPRSAEAQRVRLGEEANRGLLLEELGSRRLRADLGSKELDGRLLETYRAARLAMEEGGASGLYLALGFLVWYDGQAEARRHVAPILLLPVQMGRASVRSGFTLRAGEDEPRINVSLLELLTKQYGITPEGLDPLPEDESGLDVARIFRAFRESVRDIERWDVVEDAQLGLFSFAKFLMWRDLRERAAELMESPVVEHLVAHPDEDFEPEAVFPDAARLDEERPSGETFCPLPADSSQLAAVFAAAGGHSFVLEGPPGTGKSQTITNLIAHCLGEGKSVLFISEKMAALSVVYQRLQNIGLGRFCLEVHSNKAAKREVYRQLDEALQKSEAGEPVDWERETQRLDGLRKQLNTYVRELHEPRASGESVYEVLSRLIGLRAIARVALTWAAPDEITQDKLTRLRETVRKVATAGETVAGAHAHPWQGARCQHWTPGFEDSVSRGIGELLGKLERCTSAAAAIAPRLGLGEGDWSWAELELLTELVQLLLELPGATAAFLLHADRAAARDRILGWVLRGRVRENLRGQILGSRGAFEPAALDLDLDKLSRQWATAEASFWPLSWWRGRSVLGALRTVAKDRTKRARLSVATELKLLLELRAEEQALSAVACDAEELLGRHWNGGDPDWDAIEKIVAWADAFGELVVRAAGDDLERAAELRGAWTRMATEGRELLAQGALLGDRFTAWLAARESFFSARAELGGLLAFETWEAFDTTATRGLLESWNQNQGELRNWCYWRGVVAEADAEGLTPLIAALESGDVIASELGAVFERNYSEWWYRATLDREPLLAGFFSREHERAIQEFRDLDENILELSGRMVAARLAARTPKPGSSTLPNSEVGILKREIAKRARHMSVRRAFERLSNLIPRLKPCLLMSPMSVAQYLDAGYRKFDLVVFDEASQIPVWDAVGAIARGRQAVIVGDPKQLPPTNFFQKSEDEDLDRSWDPDEVEIEDLESILDDCIGAGFRTLHLDWHYRSRHEGLIAFSNARYYDNRLLTFPAPTRATSARSNMGVAWRHVPEAVYDKGKTRTNPKEAAAVVAEIRRRLEDPELQRFSMGVVTFSQPQQILVEDLLEELRAEVPELERFFGDGEAEPVFVKNLENVQGDERDVILFSICYGPDAAGRVSMNFGPMNREGGERRLNVAITRARRELLVFSALRSGAIDLARTRATGVQHLKEFLAYAERGMASLSLSQDAAAEVSDALQRSVPDSGGVSFEDVVQGVLEEAGWSVKRRVGCSGYRLDLAVIDPEDPTAYLLGIECDGENYDSAKTARDRDKVRTEVLTSLGWRLERIWSNDWWADPDGERARLLDRCERARSPVEETPVEEPSVPVESLPVEPEAPAASEEQQEQEEPGAGASVYSALNRGRRGGRSESFFEAGNTERLGKALVAIVEHEGPVHFPVAARRLASFWDIERMTARVLERTEEVLAASSVPHIDEDRFLWPEGADPATHVEFRVPGKDPLSQRDAEDLPDQELAAAALFLLRQHISAPLDDLVRQTARLFGFARLGSKLRERIERGVLSLLEKGAVHRDGDSLVVEFPNGPPGA